MTFPLCVPLDVESGHAPLVEGLPSSSPTPGKESSSDSYPTQIKISFGMMLNRMSSRLPSMFGSMNDLPPDLLPPNVVHLQRTQNGEPLPAEAEETSVDQFTFHLNPFSYTMVKGVQVTDEDPSFGLTLVADELSHWAHITDVKENSTADKMHATHKPTVKNVKSAHLVGINGKKVFGKDDAIAMLQQPHDECAENFELELAIERKLSSAKTWRTVAEHNIMEPSTPSDNDHQHQLTLADV